jgi:hypothetical protein
MTEASVFDRAAIIGYCRSGATVEEIGFITGFAAGTIIGIIKNHLSRTNELPENWMRFK